MNCKSPYSCRENCKAQHFHIFWCFLCGQSCKLLLFQRGSILLITLPAGQCCRAVQARPKQRTPCRIPSRTKEERIKQERRQAIIFRFRSSWYKERQICDYSSIKKWYGLKRSTYCRPHFHCFSPKELTFDIQLSRDWMARKAALEAESQYPCQESKPEQVPRQFT